MPLPALLGYATDPPSVTQGGTGVTKQFAASEEGSSLGEEMTQNTK